MRPDRTQQRKLRVKTIRRRLVSRRVRLTAKRIAERQTKLYRDNPFEFKEEFLETPEDVDTSRNGPNLFRFIPFADSAQKNARRADVDGDGIR